MPSFAQRTLGEAIGTAFLLAAVVGSGIMAQKLAGGNVALALLCNTLATGAMLVVLILIFGSVSGAHLIRSSVSHSLSEANWVAGNLPTSRLSCWAQSLASGLHISCSICRSGSFRPRYAPGRGNGSQEGRYVWTSADDFWLCCARARTRCPMPSASILPPHTGSPRRPHLQTPPSPSHAPFRTPSRALRRRVCFRLSSPRLSVAFRRRCSRAGYGEIRHPPANPMSELDLRHLSNDVLKMIDADLLKASEPKTAEERLAGVILTSLRCHSITI